MPELKASFMLLFVVIFTYFAQGISGGVLASLPDTGRAIMIQREVKHEDIKELISLFSIANSKLTILRCSLSPRNLSEILKAAFDVDSQLETLSIRQSGLNDDVLRLSLARNVSLPVTSSLKHLDISFNALSDSGIKHIATLLARLTNLECFSLSGTVVNADSFRAIAHALRKHRSITKLVFSSCRLSDEIAQLLTLLLKSNSNIKSIDISHNKISAVGFDSLFEAIGSGAVRNIEEINLSYNDLGDSGVLALSRALEINHLPNLKKLTLRSTGATPAGIAKLLTSFQSGCKIEILDLSGNHLVHQKKKLKKKSVKNIAPILKNAIQDTLSSSLKSFDKIANEIKKRANKKLRRRIPVSRRILNVKKTTSKILSKSSRKQSERKSSDIHSNKMGDEINKKTRKDSANAIYTFLDRARDLKRLDLSSTGLNDALCRDFAILVKKKLESKLSDVLAHGLTNADVNMYLNNATESNLKTMQDAIRKIAR